LAFAVFLSGSDTAPLATENTPLTTIARNVQYAVRH
jgi:hypothetical protein